MTTDEYGKDQILKLIGNAACKICKKFELEVIVKESTKYHYYGMTDEFDADETYYTEIVQCANCGTILKEYQRRD